MKATEIKKVSVYIGFLMILHIFHGINPYNKDSFRQTLAQNP